MSPGEQAKWGALFGDYEIGLPFAQLSRDTYALTETEKASTEVTRFAGIKIESTRLRGMDAHGWPLGGPQDGGGIHYIFRQVTVPGGGKTLAMLEFNDGLNAGGIEYEDKVQTLGAIKLMDDPYNRDTAHKFGQLDAVTASEMLRALTILAQSGVK